MTRLKTYLWVALVLLGTTPVWSLTVAPGRTEIRLSPGEHVNGAITTTNDTAERIQIAVSTKDWFTLEANKAKSLTIDKWLKLRGKKAFYLKPGETRSVKFTATCPKEGEGELVGMVSFMNVTNPDAMTTSVISVSVYLGVNGTEKVSGEVEQLAIHRFNGKLQAAVAMKSTGNVHLRPTGTITVVSAKPEDIATFPLKEGGPAYPGANQVYFAEVPTDFKLSKGSYTLRTHLEYRGASWDATRTFKVLADDQVKMDPA